MSERKKTALVLGAGGFIGSHMVRRLKSEGYWVRGVDIKRPEYSPTLADEFILGDLTDINLMGRSGPEVGRVNRQVEAGRGRKAQRQQI